MFGTLPVGEASEDFTLIDDNLGAGGEPQAEANDVEFEGSVVIPVLAPRLDRPWSRGRIDGSALIVTGDVPESMTMTAFERSEAQYNGTDGRGIPTIGYDEVSAENYSIS